MAASTGLFSWAGWTWRAADLVEQEIDEEFDFHIDCRTRELIESGLSPDQAAQEAQRLFGARDRLRRQCQTAIYGRGYRLIAGLALTMAVSLGVIGWLFLQLQDVQRQNLAMSALLAAEQLPSESKADLVGEIVDAEQKPVANAKVLLIYKSWPNGRYRQQAFDQTSDKNGKFRFKELYSNATQIAFNVTVLADGHAMQSKYVLYEPKADVKTFRFQLKPAIEKTLTVHGPDGEPLADAAVWPGDRKPADSKDWFLIYHQNGAAAGYKTDAKGRVRMPLFQAGDKIELHVVKDQLTEMIRFTVDDAKVQTVSLSATSGVRGTVTDAAGKPIAKAKVLLIHKSWPDGQYQQIPHDTVTDAQGNFHFPHGNVPDDREALLVTAVHDSYAFQSRYVIKPPGQTADPFEFRLTAAIKKTIVLRDPAGQPLAEATVALSQRKDAQSQDHLIYTVSSRAVSFKTDAQGKVALNHFAAKDQAQLLVFRNDDATPVRFTVDDQPEQTVDVSRPSK